MASDWDIVIAGAGLSGLSLAAELARPEFSHFRILLIEPRTTYQRDRTWSFWALPEALPARWQSLVQTHWQQWRVSYQDRQVLRSGRVAYASVRADAFYEKALSDIEKTTHIHWRRQTSIDRVRTEPLGVALITSTGEALHTALFFDSRPPSPAAPGQWVQQFKGWEVRSPRPCFEPQCMDLMAFEPSSKGLHFIYCLPYSSTQALVESTWIKRADDRDDFDAELREALIKRWDCRGEDIVFSEQGALPLWPDMPNASPGIVRIGRAGGALRASTGYAFCASLHHSAALAQSLRDQVQSNGSLQTWQPPAPQSSVWDAKMDRILFRVLEQDWMQAPHYFVDLFDKVPADALVRFLHGASSWQDRFAVMRALPAWPFMQAALKG
jgi:lycopene beta-cyclase